MSYTNKATSKTQAYIIFLVDRSESMEVDCYGSPRINVVADALNEVIFRMVDVSSDEDENGAIQTKPRFQIAILGYNDSDKVSDAYGGFVPIDEVVNRGIPIFEPKGRTNTFRAFQQAFQLLNTATPQLTPLSPAPLICHLTDGQFNEGNRPDTIADQIRQIMTADGPILVENIFVTDTALQTPITDIGTWKGVQSEAELVDDYAKMLFRMSSPIPPSYLPAMGRYGFKNIQQQARLMFPGTYPDLIKAALAITSLTGEVNRPRDY